MKKLFNLQLFAEEPTPTAASAASVATDQGNPITDKEPATAAEQEKKYTDADVDRIVKGKKVEWQKTFEKEIAAAKEAEKEAAKLEKMNAQQQAEYKLEEANKRIAEYERKETLAEMTKTARKMLSEDGITVSDELLTMFVNTDAENTKAAVDSFSKLFKEAVESAVKDRLRGETPKTSTVTTPISEFEKKMKKYT